MSNLEKIRAMLWNKIGSRFFACTPQNAYAFRTLMLKFFGMKCGLRVRVRRNVFIDKPWNVVADDLVIFGDRSIINATAQIRIGKRSVISQYAMLMTKVGSVSKSGLANTVGSINIEADCWIATDTLVLPNASVKTGTVVGARSIVQGQLPSWSICTGEPAVVRTSRVLYGP